MERDLEEILEMLDGWEIEMSVNQVVGRKGNDTLRLDFRAKVIEECSDKDKIQKLEGKGFRRK